MEASTTEPADELQRLKVPCWACGTQVQLPEASIPQGGSAYDVRFTCAVCQAVNHPHSVEPPGCVPGLGPKKHKGASQSTVSMRLMVGRVSVTAVPVIVISIFIEYLVSALPLLFSYTSLVDALSQPALVCHVAHAIFLLIQVLYNFSAAAFGDPGSPANEVEYGSKGAAEKTDFAGFSLCRRCTMPRPDRAYHCSTCTKCILDLDHHCMFIHNCVGYKNRRNFVLFLLYAVVACLQVFTQLPYLVFTRPGQLLQVLWPECMPIEMQNFYESLVGHPPMMADGKRVPEEVVWKSCAGWSLWLLPAMYLKGTAVSLVVGYLLIDQISSLWYDMTGLQVSELRKDSKSKQGGSFANIKATMGPPHSWIWLWQGPLPPELGGRPAPRELGGSQASSRETVKKKN